MATAAEWLTTASENLEVASQLSAQHAWRSAVSRAYYAAHNGVHALLMHFEADSVPVRGTWRHGDLPGELRKLLQNHLGVSRLSTEISRRKLVAAYELRVSADYKPRLVVDSRAYERTRDAAAHILHYATRVLK